MEHTLSITSKQLGATGVQIPAIGFGTWQYSGGVAPLIAAVENGAAFIDTAETYGTEETVGEALKGRRNQVFLATKVRPANFRHKDVKSAAEASLRRLQTDHIDLYQLHWPNYTIPIEETMAAMEELVDEGKIRFIGVSNFFVRELKAAHAALRKHAIVSNQVRYSVIERTIENGLLQYCQQNQITIIAYSPFGTKFSALHDCDPEGVLARVAQSNNKSRAQVALNWLIQKQGVVAIPKASSVEHVLDDCGAANWQLSDEDNRLLTERIRFRKRSSLELLARKACKYTLQLTGRAV